MSFFKWQYSGKPQFGTNPVTFVPPPIFYGGQETDWSVGPGSEPINLTKLAGRIPMFLQSFSLCPSNRSRQNFVKGFMGWWHLFVSPRASYPEVVGKTAPSASGVLLPKQQLGFPKYGTARSLYLVQQRKMRMTPETLVKTQARG